jgi:cation diffusion facilitator family transporter
MSAARRTALTSLCAAIVLFAAKLVVGLASGSLGVLAEAVHSAADAGAALLTFYAVSIAERPADREHQYGHGKAQHLSALAEAAVLAAVAVFVATEAFQQLESGNPSVEPTWYAFALMFGVLGIDAARASISLKRGRALRSDALLANAWHFGSDFAGTLAVLIGLLIAAAGAKGADAVAAVFVAALVLAAAARLALRNVNALMDRAPAGLRPRIEEAVRAVPGVSEVRSVRVREAGGQLFADVVIGVSRLEGLERSHDTMDAVEAVVERAVGPSLVTVHVEPTAGEERANERVAAAAMRVPGVMEVHNITVLEDPSGSAITLHARVQETLSLRAASGVVERLKQEIACELDVAHVYVHVEPFAPDAIAARDVSAEEPDVYAAATAAVHAAAGGDSTVVVYRQGERLLVVTAIEAEPTLSVRQGHSLASRVEDAVRAAVPEIDDVIVEVTEPGRVRRASTR